MLLYTSRTISETL